MNRVRGRTATIVAAACLAATLVAVPSAQAAVTTSAIATPSNMTYLMYTADSPNTFAVSGTTDGTTGDQVDVNCYDGDGVTPVAGNVAVNSNGTFSVPAADLHQAVTFTVCHLRAVPSGTTPNPLTPYSGPRLLVDSTATNRVSTGPNAGHVYDFYAYAQQTGGGFDFDSIGGCGLDDSYLLDSNNSLTTVVFYCNDWLTAGGARAPSRSQLQIDGVNAYTPDSARSINDQAPGLPAVTYSYSLDTKTGNFVIHDTESFVECPDQTWPTTSATCPSFVLTGVTDHRTLVQDHNGRVVWITDKLTSTDGKAHTLNLQWQNDQRLCGPSCNTTQIEYRFPGQSGYSTHVVTDNVALPHSGGTIRIRTKGAADGATGTGIGAIVYDRPASGATFNYIVSSQNDFTLNQTATVPAGGSTTFRTAYVQGFMQANVNALAQFATLTFKGCTVPNLVGKTLAAAKKTITRAHCTVGRIAYARSAAVGKGRIVSQKPKAKTHVAYRAKVALVVSTGA